MSFYRQGIERAGLGDTVECNSGESIRFYAGIKDLKLKSKWINLKLIKNGDVIYTEKYSLPAVFIFPTKGPESGKDFYRIEIKAQDGSHVVSNPIFIVSR